MPNLDYGMNLEDVFAKKLGESQFAAPTISPELMAFGDKIGITKPEPTWTEKFMKGFQDVSPLIAQIGTSLMRGRNTITGAPTETVGSQIGGALTGALGTMKMNEALKKMIAQQLSGGGGVGGGAGFSEGQPVGLTSAETVGLSPEQVTGLYKTGLETREKELKRPFESIQALSESYSKIMTGEAKPAEIALHNATAQKTLAEIDKMSTNSWQEWEIKEATKAKIIEETEEIKAKTKAIPTETTRKKAETLKTEAETRKLDAQLDTQQVRLLKFAETVGWERVDRGNVIELRDKASGALMTTLTVGAKPESAKEAGKYHMEEIKFATNQVAPYLIPLIESDWARTATGKKAADLRDLLAALKPIGGGEVDVKTVKGLAARIPGLSEKFDRAIGAYIEGKGDEEFKGKVVRGILASGTKLAPAEKPTEKKSMLEKFKEIVEPTPTSPDTNAQITKQLTGKPADSYTVNFKSGKNITVYWDGKRIAQKPSSTPPPYGTY